MINNYSPAPKWEWLEVDIYRAVERRGKYPLVATDTGVNSSFSYHIVCYYVLLKQCDSYRIIFFSMRERAVFYTNIWVLIDGSIADLLSISW